MKKLILLFILVAVVSVNSSSEHDYSIGCLPQTDCTVRIEENVNIANEYILSDIRLVFNYSGKSDYFNVSLVNSFFDYNSSNLTVDLKNTQGQIIDLPTLIDRKENMEIYRVHMRMNRSFDLVSIYFTIRTKNRIIPLQYDYVGNTRFWATTFRTVLRSTSNVNVTSFQRVVHLDPNYKIVANPFEEIDYNSQNRINVRLDETGYQVSQFYYYSPSDEITNQFHLYLSFEDERTRGKIQAFWGIFGVIVSAIFTLLMEKKRITKAITMGFGVYVLSLIGGFNLDQSITIGFIGSILWAIIIYEKEIGQIVSNIFYKRKSGKAKIRVNTRSSPPEPKNSRKRKEKIKL